jgi:4-hydroxy-tetrahydrodipicolinate reductase
MGRTLVRLAADADDLAIIGGIDTESGEENGMSIVTMDDAAGMLGRADVVIDFSSAAATRALLEHDARALVIGTTGLGADADHALKRAAQQRAILTAANFSIGVNLLLVLAERAGDVLDAGYDAEIVEAHHNRKVDAPSGTALALAEAVARGRDVKLGDVRRDGRSGDTGARPQGEIGIHAVRGGGVVGEHRLMFIGERERIELTHIAMDRSLFAEGALRAARWIAGRAAGRYTMKQVLGL